MNNYSPFKRCLREITPRWIGVAKLKATTRKQVLFTFDDGPNEEYTPTVLDILNKYQARGVFFVTGEQVEAAPNVLCRIAKEGHWIGNHSYSHPIDRNLTYREYLNDLVKCQEVIFRILGEYPTLFRPPGGKTSISSLFAPKKIGLSTIFWSRSSRDWLLQSQEQADECFLKLKNKVSSRDILLFHDTNPYALSIIEGLLRSMLSEGYSFSPQFDHILP